MRPATLVACMFVAASYGANAAPPNGSHETPDATSPGTVAQGKAVFAQWCAGCHGPLPGVGRFPPAGSYRLQQRYKDTKPATLENRADLTPALIKAVVRLGLPIMPPLRKTEVNDAELDALIAYLTRDRGLRGVARPDGFEPPTTGFEARRTREAGDLTKFTLLANQKGTKPLLPGHRCKCHH
jgi:mono/diheme cytochrome c family protein